MQLLIKTLRLPGLLELASLGAPTQLVLCEKDRVFPTPRGNRYFLTHLPKDTQVIRLDGVGHIPMLEAPGDHLRTHHRLRRRAHGSAPDHRLIPPHDAPNYRPIVAAPPQSEPLGRRDQ